MSATRKTPPSEDVQLTTVVQETEKHVRRHDARERVTPAPLRNVQATLAGPVESPSQLGKQEVPATPLVGLLSGCAGLVEKMDRDAS